MKCKVCNAESGKYPLCRACNAKKEAGEISKCAHCGNWHYINTPCPTPITENTYLYELKDTLISKSEQLFFTAIQHALPNNYCVFPQINLATFIHRTDTLPFRNELFRNVDFLITDADFCPKIVVEINDQSHLSQERKERDQKVQKICEEAGIPILKLWTSYGVNQEYIQNKIKEILSTPFQRTNHPDLHSARKKKEQDGCYIATCVYGSYHCPPVYVLRRFRDNYLKQTLLGRMFVKCYYKISPLLVQWLGRHRWFQDICRSQLNPFVSYLESKGYSNSPYNDHL